MKQHHLSVTRTARYFALGNSTNPSQLWFVLHGYGQLAQRFISEYSVLDENQNLVVAPEALSRFYFGEAQRLHGPHVSVGAPWMTREDRESEISDYVGYLDALYDRVFDDIDRSTVAVRVLGFSQGADTACRWIDRGRIAVDHLILWAGPCPSDVDLTRRDHAGVKISIVVGNSDALATPERIERLEERLRGREYDLVRFDGGHHLDKSVLMKLAEASA
jgi:predicted esterase